MSVVLQCGDIKSYAFDDLEKLAHSIREFLIENVSKTGGHIGANLGVVELTIAIHFACEVGDVNSQNPLFFDVGHQGYTHKILTGRAEDFCSLNEFGGMSRFISNHEHKTDLMEASHAGTAISIASGLSYARYLRKDKRKVIALIGDGSISEGMAFEGLNFVPQYELPLMIIVNDNGMSIPPSVGGLNRLFSDSNWQSVCLDWFLGLGYEYIAVENGHSFNDLVPALRAGLAADGPVVVHVKTEKGRGLPIAKEHPYRLHFSLPFDPISGAGISATIGGATFHAVVGEELEKIVKSNKDSVVISPATPYASGIEKLLTEYPDQVFDVGMAEQHALGMAAGLCLANKRPFVCVQSTFLQRAIDQLFHDISYPNHPVTIISSRSGFAGFDGPTHHGIYDFGLLRSIPNLAIFYAGTERDLREIIRIRQDYSSHLSDGPMVILHPYEQISVEEDNYLPIELQPIQNSELVSQAGADLIIAVGNRLEQANRIQKILSVKGYDFSVVNLRWIAPLPVGNIRPLIGLAERVLILEEARKESGIGVPLSEAISRDNPSIDILINSIDLDFVPGGSKSDLIEFSGLSDEKILEMINGRWFLT